MTAKRGLSKVAKLNNAAIAFYKYLLGNRDYKEVCKIMGYCHTTHHKRLKEPESFTLKELRIIYREAQLPDEVFMRMIREEKA